eukprot:INCI9132.1.p1 GENE.INCI9132.1~~INCI9132.1.p1  ORF type:complete len:241 (+),score=32.76 INCI9132.1:86-808(+)
MTEQLKAMSLDHSEWKYVQYHNTESDSTAGPGTPRHRQRAVTGRETREVRATLRRVINSVVRQSNPARARRRATSNPLSAIDREVRKTVRGLVSNVVRDQRVSIKKRRDMRECRRILDGLVRRLVNESVAEKKEVHRCVNRLVNDVIINDLLSTRTRQPSEQGHPVKVPKRKTTSTSAHDSSAKFFMVTVPDEWTKGNKVVFVHDRQRFLAAVPSNCSAGSSFLVSIKTPGGGHTKRGRS